MRKWTISKIAALAGAIAGALAVGSAKAYDITTHALIAYKAYQRSVLNPDDPQSIVGTLGFDRLDKTDPFTNTYFDNQALSDDPAQFTLSQQQQELEVFQALIAANQIPDAANVDDFRYRVDGWLMQGDIREDDNDALYPLTNIYFTQDHRAPDPWGNLLRAGRHFYDPLYDRAFAYPVCADYGCVRSPVWAMGTQHPLSPPNDAEDATRRNHFTWVDARKSYWSALTNERYPNGGTALDRFSSSFERQQRWATAIASLGHVIHLLQDGAQPQHTRNDSHAPPLASLGRNQGNAAAYEAFTDYRVTGTAEGGLNNPLRLMSDNLPSLGQLPPLVFDGYPIPTFALPVKFFTTKYDDPGTGDSAINARKGMIDFSNRNFFTAGTYPGFRECSPPGTIPCSRQNVTYQLPENDITDTSIYTAVQVPSPIIVNGQTVTTTMYTRRVVDAVNPNYADRLPPQFGGKVPIISKATFADYAGAVPQDVVTNLRFENFVYDADVLLPRAVAYSAGVINFFFRGQLEVLTPNDHVVGVLNQGATHTMNAQGYPCQGTASVDGCPIFGFEKVRLRVRNATVAITESGTGANVPQNTGGTSAQLVAVAKYHRNSCYKPDLSGERVQSYAPPPQLIITEPGCGSGQTVRTDYQEISVSAPLTVAAGELDNQAAGTGIEKLFDFASDPIPVNATDLFIQVVYRGTLGQETDGVAVGTLDVREPTFTSFWNNTDYWWNGGTWFPHSTTYPNDGAKDFWACAGGAPVKLVFFYQGANGAPALIDPVAGSNQAGMVRLGFIFPPPDPGIPAQRKNVRGVPVAYSIPGIPQIPMQSISTPAVFRQANKEHIDASTLSAPYNTCAAGLPSTPEYWCFDTVQKRRNQIMGAPMQPFYLEPIGTGTIPPDVDASPAQPAFAAMIPLATGTVRFNTDVTLATCPAQPTSAEQPVDAESVRHIELQEEASDLGMDDGQ